MTRIVLQGKKVYDTFETESVQGIMELHLKAQENAKETIKEAIMTLESDWVARKEYSKSELKEIDKLAKSIRDNVKFLTAEYTLVDGGETYKIGEEK